jgi:hypothetical protein
MAKKKQRRKGVFTRSRVSVRASKRRSTVPEPYSAPAPVPGPDAFQDLTDSDHVHSQAATLLLIGSHLRGDAPASQAQTQAAVHFMQLPPTQNEEPPAHIPAEDISALGFPSLSAGAFRFPPSHLEKALGLRFRAAPAPAPPPGDVSTASKKLPDAAANFYRDANVETAASLLEASLRHPNQLVRVSAAASYLEVTTDPQPAIRILVNGLGSRDHLASDLAAYALAHADPKNPNLDKLLRSRRRRTIGQRSRTSTIIHGTWAASSPWWQPIPQGDFWRYLHDQVNQSLYGASDRFGWSGGYSDAARAIAGNDLVNWVNHHHLDGLDLFTHSHGGNVAMLANQAAITMGKLVLLSCPVHFPKYMPDFPRVRKAVSIRVHLDLVILADRGGQYFHDDRISEHVLGVWFDHFATHNPAVWQRYNLPAML